ncbi:MAG: DUF2341 domain-containing protein, partial [Candidatus Hodarchaeales archaeon]
MLIKNNIFSYLLLSIFVINLATLVINLEDWTPDIRELEPEYKIGYPPYLMREQRDSTIENGSGNSQLDTSPLISSQETRSNNPNLGGIRSKIQSDYSAPNWVDTRWRYRKNITIDYAKVSTDLTNFPLLINLYDSDLRIDAQASGSDILFIDESGNKLDHEIEVYNRVYSSSLAHLVAWVKINLSNSQNTVISMYYGNPTAENQENPSGVWDDDQVGVWHLSESGDGSIGEFDDSSSYSNDGQGGGGNSSYIPTRVQGKIGYGQNFINSTGNYDYIDCGNDTSLDITGNEITIEAWIKHNIVPASGVFYGILNHKGYNDGYRLLIPQNSLKLEFELPGQTHQLTSATDVTTGTWHHVVATYNGSKMEIYIDGVKDANDLDKTGNIEPSSPQKNVWIGHGDQPVEKSYSYPWVGQIDEVHISKIARSGDWIATEYSNQNDPDGFYTVSSVETLLSDWSLPLFKHRKTITIDAAQVSGNLINFPVLVNLTDTDLQNTNKVQSDGDDILFTDAYGTKLDHEIEYFNQSIGHLTAWVRVPSLSATNDTKLLMYYGNDVANSQENPEGVWDDNYEFVLHMNQDPSSSDILDSTGNSFDFDVESSSSMTSDDLVDGKTGKALSFDGVDDYIYLPLAEGFSGPTDKMTFEFWIIFPSGGPTSRDYLATPATVDLDPNLAFYNEFELHVQTDSGYVASSTQSSFTAGTWYNIVAVWDGTGAGLFRIYIGGNLDKDDSPRTGTHVSWNTFSIGAEEDDIDGPGGSTSDREIHATVSEFRLSNVVRSAEWISTNHANQNNPASFYSVGSEENSPDNWSMPLFRHRKTITINASQVNGTLTNFPILINILDTDLHDTASVQVDGDDIAFTDAFGNRLDHEMELFNQTGNGTHANLVAWIRIPSISNSSHTNIKMYYGNDGIVSQENPEGVWEDNFVGVWHLEESSSGLTGEFIDSSSFGNGGQGGEGNSTCFPLQVTGKIGNGQEFDGDDDIIGMGNTPSLNITGDAITLESWIYVPAFTSTMGVMCKSGFKDGYRITVNSASRTYFQLTAESGYEAESSGTMSTGTWHHVVSRYDGTTMNIFIDGMLDPGYYSRTGNIDSTSKGFVVGHGDQTRDKAWSYPFGGIIDEVRISTVARSADWIATEYNNQLDPDNFYSIGGEENSPWSMPLFRYRKTVTINASEVSGSGNLINFPVLVNLTDANLQDTDKVQVDGDDIVFTDASGTKLDHEIEYFNQSTGQLIAWVRLPSLSNTSDTNITMYYGNNAVNSQENPEGVWDSNYKGVWHLSEDPTGTVYDSTSNNHDSTSYGSMTSGDQVAGQVDGSLDFDGTDDYIQWSNTIAQSTGTYSFWYYTHSITGERNIIADDAWLSRVGLWDDVVKIETDTDGELFDFTSSSIPINTWTHIVFARAGDFADLYVNGLWVQQVEVVGADILTVSCIGGTDNLARMVDGMIDEVRVSNVVRSADWITTGYNNQYDPNNFLSVDAEEVYSSWWSDGSFSKRKDIVINRSKVSSDLNNFPVLVDLNDTDMHDTNKIQADGDDILFTDASGTKLDHEIELFDQAGNGTHAHLVAWVGLPGLSSTEDTTISMYYGNNALENQEFPEGVWNSNFAGVWHLKEDPSGSAPQMKDSTSYSNHGTSQGSITGTDAHIDGGLVFDGSDDYVNTSSNPNFGTGSFTIMVWYKGGETGNYRGLAGAAITGSTGFALNNHGGYLSSWINDDTDTGTISISDNNWHHCVLVRNGSNGYLYVDGVLDASFLTSSASVDVAQDFWIGGWGNPIYLIGGTIDEVRISNINRSVDWITTEYNNQYNPSNFYSVGSESVYDETPPVVNDYGVDDPGTGIGTFWADITDTASDVTGATIKINGTEYSMNYDSGTRWVYQQSVNLTDYYTYQITNSSDTYGNKLTTATSERSYTFIQDSIAPTVVDWEYYAEQ